MQDFDAVILKSIKRQKNNEEKDEILVKEISENIDSIKNRTISEMIKSGYSMIEAEALTKNIKHYMKNLFSNDEKVMDIISMKLDHIKADGL